MRRTTTLRPFFVLVTLALVLNGSVGCAALNAF